MSLGETQTQREKGNNREIQLREKDIRRCRRERDGVDVRDWKESEETKMRQEGREKKANEVKWGGERQSSSTDDRTVKTEKESCASDSNWTFFFFFFFMFIFIFPHESPEWPLNGLLHKGHLVSWARGIITEAGKTARLWAWQRLITSNTRACVREITEVINTSRMF